MTRRITWAILITFWAILIAASLTVYLTTFAVMKSHLDEAMLDEVMQGRAYTYRGRNYVTVGSRHLGDIGSIKSGGSGEPEPHAQVMHRTWVHLPGERNRHRSMVVRVWARPVEGGELTPIVVPYRREAYEFDPLMSRLQLGLAIATVAGGLVAAVVARLIARASLRPLRSTADVIGTIDDRNLDRRIDAEKLPPELVPMADRLNGMLERIDAAMRKRQRFLADASHELRTPVAALIAALEYTTRKPRDAATYREALESCLADARHLRLLVEALMAQVKSEAAPQPDAHDSIMLDEFVANCIAMLRPLALQRGIEISREIPTTLRLWTQPARLKAILINLLSNAVTYNREGGRIDLFAETGADRWVEIHVRDTGEGIAPDKLPYVFEPFYRGDESRQSSEHLGLGLFLVSSNVRALGGECRVESTLGEGTRFRIRLPNHGGGGASAPDGAASKSLPAKV